MAEHTPKFNPGAELTFTASAAVTGGQLVAVTGARTVGPAGAGSAAWVGVAGNDAAIGELVHVTSGNVHELTSSGAIAAGGTVVAGAAGVVTAAAAETGLALVGIALSAAASNKVLVKLAR